MPSLSEIIIRGTFNQIFLKSVYVDEVIKSRKTGGWYLFQSDEVWSYVTMRDDRVCDECAPLDGQVIAGDAIPRNFPNYEIISPKRGGAYDVNVVVHPHVHDDCRCRIYLEDAVRMLEARLHQEKLYAVNV